MQRLLLLLSIILLSACARELPDSQQLQAVTAGKTRVHFHFEEKADFNIFATSPILVITRRLEGINNPAEANEQSLVINSGTTTTTSIDNGNYTIAAIAFNGSAIDMTEANSERCGFVGNDPGAFTTLNGEDVDVFLTITQDGCKDFNFSSSVQALKVISCDNTGDSNQLVDGSSCDGASSRPGVGNISFFRAEIVPFTRGPNESPSFLVGTGLKSSCVAVSSGVALTNLYIPTQSPVLVQIKTYSDASCLTEIKAYSFPKGLATAGDVVPQNTAKFINGASENSLFLFNQ